MSTPRFLSALPLSVRNNDLIRKSVHSFSLPNIKTPSACAISISYFDAQTQLLVECGLVTLASSALLNFL